jgi:Alginate lyase
METHNPIVSSLSTAIQGTASTRLTPVTFRNNRNITRRSDIMKIPARFLAILLAILATAAGEVAKPRTLALRGASLAEAKAELKRGETRLAVPLAQLRAEADALLKRKPASVLDKSLTAASGDRHDYFSFAPYWWPDPKKPDGLPYLRRDGDRNPDSTKGTDDAAFSRTCRAVETLGLAFYFTGDERYATKAATLVRVWFLDPPTRMNPNLQHAQAIPGVSPGRAIGIIDSRNLVNLIDGLALIDGSPAWQEKDATAMKAWLADFHRWLTTSENGREEATKTNNHGTWWDVQAATLALAIGRPDEAKKILAAVPAKRIASQIEPDGRQPHELARTRSLAYSCFNLEAFLLLGRLGEHVDLDLWNFATGDGRSLGAALRYLAPFADPALKWPKKEITPTHRARLLPLLREGLHQTGEAGFRAPLEEFGARPAPGEYWRFSGPDRP